MPSPWILPDEILYSDLARSIADGGPPAVRGVPAFGWGVVYPTLIAPAWALFGDPVSAYHAALVINALVMSLAAIPAYLLARLFVSRRVALVVAAMTVLVPSMAYTGVVMTENAFYPLFLWSVFLIARAVRRPTLASQLAGARAASSSCRATRIQGVVLVGAYARGRRALRADRAARRSAGVPARASCRRSLRSERRRSSRRSRRSRAARPRLAGGRSGTFDALRPGEVPQWFAYLAGGLVLYVALIPAAASVI